MKNAMVYEISLIIQCVVLQWLADHNDLVVCSCKYILLLEHCDRGFECQSGRMIAFLRFFYASGLCDWHMPVKKL